MLLLLILFLLTLMKCIDLEQIIIKKNTKQRCFIMLNQYKNNTKQLQRHKSKTIAITVASNDFNECVGNFIARRNQLETVSCRFPFKKKYVYYLYVLFQVNKPQPRNSGTQMPSKISIVGF